MWYHLLSRFVVFMLFNRALVEANFGAMASHPSLSSALSWTGENVTTIKIYDTPGTGLKELIITALSVALWTARWHYGGRAATADLLLFSVLCAWQWRVDIMGLLWKADATLLFAFTGIFLLSSLFLNYRKSVTILEDHGEQGNTFVGRPTFLPGRTNHTRMSPTKHSFSFSYLLVAIPVGWKGSLGGLLSVDLQARGRDGRVNPNPTKNMTWFNVEAEDYLTRGDPHAGLDGRLRTYLRSQGIDPAEYPMAYLVTAPRFLGYSFNPVSFWYLYDEGKQLKAMILEVNNTFDERRMYFLGQAPEPDRIPASSPQQTISKGDVGPAHDHAFEMSPGKLRASWPKDFHVSPFNSRDGTYSLVASDPSFPDTDGQGPVRNHITLRSPQGPVTLVASVFSEGPSLDPSNMTIWGSLRFVAMWWWVGLMTFPRIVREAGKLFLKRRLGMRVYWRPEVRLNSIAREETLSERTLEMFFRNFLEHKVAGLDIPIVVNYKAALRNHPRTETFSSPSVPSHPEDTEVVDVVVLTPVFYGRFVHYAHMMEAFSMEMLCPEEENKTVSVSNPELLPKIFAGSSDSQIGKYHGTQTLSGLLGTLRWMCLRALRTHPPPPSYLATIRQASGPPKNDIRSFPFAPIDKFVDEKCNAEEARAYRAAVTELFLSNRFALGDPGILQAYDFVLRIILLYIAARHVACHPSSVTGQMLTSGLRGFIDPAIMFCIYNGANIWASLKAAVLEGRS